MKHQLKLKTDKNLAQIPISKTRTKFPLRCEGGALMTFLHRYD